MDQELTINFSAVVVCYNEAHLLPTCLGSLSFCQELIVVDLGSEDNSVEVAQAHGARVLYHERQPHPNLPRQYGISQAQNEWVFTIDADEVFPSHEVKKIEAVLLTHPDLDAVRVPIQYYFRGHKLNSTVWGYPGRTRWTVLNRDRARGTSYAHQEFELNQNIHYFSWDEITPIDHYWRNSYQELFEKLRPYIPIEGESRYAKGQRFSWPRTLKATLVTLQQNLFYHRGLWGGVTGVSLSVIYSWYIFMCWLSLRQYEQQLTKQHQQT